jgi:Tfp pilus assembly protein PilO
MKLNKQQIQMISLISIVFVAFFLGFQLLLVSPDALALSKKKEQLSTQENDIKKNQNTAKKSEELKKEIEIYLQKDKEYLQQLVTPADFEFFKYTIRDMGNEYNVKVTSDRTDTVDDTKKSVFLKDPNYSERIIALEVSCQYHDLGGYLSRIESTSPFRKIEEFTLNKRGGSKKSGGGLDANIRILSLIKEGN